MTLLLTFLIIYGLNLHYSLYILATILYAIRLIIKARLLTMEEERHAEILRKFETTFINTTEDMPSFSDGERKRLKKFIKDLQL